MPDRPAASEVRRAAALMTEPSNMSKITESTGIIGALSGSKAGEFSGAAAGCLDFRMSSTLLQCHPNKEHPLSQVKRIKVEEQQQSYPKTLT